MDVLTKKEEEEILSELKEGEVIEQEVAISWDGRNLLTRFPKEIADFLGITEENRFKKNIKFIVEEINGKVKKRFEVVERKNGKRKEKKKDNKAR